jgi:purine nucleoside permease
MTNYQPPHVGERGEIKVLTVAMFEVGDPTGDSPGEAQLWIEGEKLDQVIEVPGSHSPLYCNTAKDHCLVISGKGKANAASTIMAVGLSDQVDLTRTYILVAGIAGIQLDDGTLGTAARRAPFVTKGDIIDSDTYWQGEIPSDWAEWWTKQFSGGQGNYCMTTMEDTGTLTALSRLAAAGRVDRNRVMVLRTASDFDQPYPGQTTLQSLQADSGGYMLAIQNAYRVGSVVAQHFITHWDEWKDDVPPLP